MTQEEKSLLLKDLCARLPYGVRLDNGLKLRTIDVLTRLISCSGSNRYIDYVKPYLRPMSSMTEEELSEHRANCRYHNIKGTIVYEDTYKSFDWLNAHHFDYRYLISQGLAIEAPGGIYN